MVSSSDEMSGDIRSSSSSSSTGAKKQRKKKPYNDVSVHGQFVFPCEHDHIICNNLHFA